MPLMSVSSTVTNQLNEQFREGTKNEFNEKVKDPAEKRWQDSKERVRERFRRDRDDEADDGGDD